MRSAQQVVAGLDAIARWQEEVYADLHRHPELSMQETRTADTVAGHLRAAGYQVHRIGGGVVGALTNGPGPTVLFRADMDALPVTETTGLPYASEKTGVMHACGHDIHVACGLSAARLLAARPQAWSGTYLALFQPGEETAAGAQAMLDDGLTSRIPAPGVALSQHVLTDPPAGHLATAAGPVFSAGDSIRVTIHGKGSHGSMPHLGVDPIVLAASIVLRLQTIPSRLISPSDFAVVTVGSLHAGAKSNIIPDEAVLLLNVRTYDTHVRDTVLAAIERIVRTECSAAATPRPPSFEHYEQFPVTDNDSMVTDRVTAAFRGHFGTARVHRFTPVPASEDFSRIPDAFGAPYTYWGLGGFADGSAVLPNHNPGFAPAMQPTLRTGTEAAVVATLAHMGAVADH
ncbi:amidohydrolase [Actinoplanes sp. NPDC024001]|uniref:amidohydrolase n=1 Tax=Actinoplanes sp. NPDC024001 TaxID=3154598 RepID=UPI0033D36751